MRNFLSILFCYLFFCGLASAEQTPEIAYLVCKGKIPIDSSSNEKTETFVKIDYKNSRLLFGDGYEYISKFKWDNKDWNFESLGGVRTDGSLERIDHAEYFSINRFTGEGMFYYAKTKESKWEIMKEIYKVKCKRVERSF
jgi:hypothetical protein